MKLFEFTMQAQALYDALVEDADSLGIDDDTREQIIADTMEGMDAEEKLESYCKIIRQLEYEEKNAAEEKKRIESVQKHYKAEIDRMKKNVADYYDATGATKAIAAGTFKVSKRRSETTEITDESLIPNEFWRIKREAMKADIKAAIKAGREVPGAALVENYSIQIK